ncbi:DUF541 domain-containing protein [Nakamurella sp. YIM 132087]|uniref:DUF541 domain-containing protein n=1 Tax=Nakamurella alba TaxID=2665158 RepID=A0A7K1FKU2_9ACTN|nr:SIMPL domain-containing protein [Nakamurella alba]MTD13853.1 DUF541 domain-containing protein [Nakamurella alba]
MSRTARIRTVVVASGIATALLTAAGCSTGTAAAGAPAGATATVTSSGTAPGGGSTADRRVITATGVGIVTGTPDTFTLQLGVATSGATAKGAMESNAEKATALIAQLKAGGVLPEDLQTSQLSVQPVYDKEGRTVTGYRVSNMVTATVHDITAAGDLIDAAQSAAGDAIRVDGISFSIDDDSELKAAARADAVRQAQAQAQQMAEAAGVPLGAVASITEAPRTVSPYPMGYAASASDSAMSMPVEAGSQELSVTVQVVYLIG